MSASRAAVMVVGVNLLAVWAAAAAGGRVGQPAPPRADLRLTAEQAVVQAQSSLVEATDRLRRHGGAPAAGAMVTRDPFRFAGAIRYVPRAEAAVDEHPAPHGGRAAPRPVEPTVPDIVLQGMAETREGDAVVRTAILSAGGELVLATLGTTVGGRYTVVALTAESVDLEDAQGGPRRTIRMK